MSIFDFLQSKTKLGPPAQVLTLPQTSFQQISPYIEDYSRRILASYFGVPGESPGMIGQRLDVPIEQTAGLTPLQLQSRALTLGLGGFRPYLGEAERLFGKREAITDTALQALPFAGRAMGRGLGTLSRAEMSGLGSLGLFDPQSSRAFFNPFEEDVVQQTLQDVSEGLSKASIGAGDRAISRGAFGGSRARVGQEELARQAARGATERIGALRSSGFADAQRQAMSAFENARRAQQGLASLQAGIGAQQAGIGQQIAGLGQTAAGLGGQFGQIGSGFAGLGQQGQNQLANQINLMNQLGGQGQATQQAALSRQFGAAQRMADMPFQRLMRGQQLLTGMPFGQFGGGTQATGYQREAFQQPSGIVQGIGALGSLNTIFPQIGTGIGNFVGGLFGNQQSGGQQPINFQNLAEQGYAPLPGVRVGQA